MLVKNRDYCHTPPAFDAHIRGYPSEYCQIKFGVGVGVATSWWKKSDGMFNRLRHNTGDQNSQTLLFMLLLLHLTSTIMRLDRT